MEQLGAQPDLKRGIAVHKYVCVRMRQGRKQVSHGFFLQLILLMAAQGGLQPHSDTCWSGRSMTHHLVCPIKNVEQSNETGKRLLTIMKLLRFFSGHRSLNQGDVADYNSQMRAVIAMDVYLVGWKLLF